MDWAFILIYLVGLAQAFSCRLFVGLYILYLCIWKTSIRNLVFSDFGWTRSTDFSSLFLLFYIIFPSPILFYLFLVTNPTDFSWKHPFTELQLGWVPFQQLDWFISCVSRWWGVSGRLPTVTAPLKSIFQKVGQYSIRDRKMINTRHGVETNWHDPSRVNLMDPTRVMRRW